MIYFTSDGNLTSNIVLPKEQYIEELRSLKKNLLNNSSYKVSAVIVNSSLDDDKTQMNSIINLNDFIIDDYMISTLFNAFKKLSCEEALYVLKKISLDYDFFLQHVFDKISFKSIESYCIRDLEVAHKINTKFEILDNYNDLLLNVSCADSNSTVLNLSKKISDIRNKKTI